MAFKIIFVLLSIFEFFYLIDSAVVASLSNNENDIQVSSNRIPKALPTIPNSFLGDFKHIYKVYEECNSKDLSPCLKIKFITALDRLSRKLEIPIYGGITLVKNDKSENNEIDDSENDEKFEASLPRALEEKDEKLDSIMLEKVINFISSRSIQFRLSGIKDIQRSLQEHSAEDGRGKKNKMSSLMLLPMMMAGSMIPMALGVLALLAGKALIIAKLALTLSLIIGLKKLLSSDDHSSYQVVGHGAGGGGHFRRSLQDDTSAEIASQSMAYKAYIPLNFESSTSKYVF